MNLSIRFIDTSRSIKSPKKSGTEMSGLFIKLNSTSDATASEKSRVWPSPMYVEKVAGAIRFGNRLTDETKRANMKPLDFKESISLVRLRKILSRKLPSQSLSLSILILLMDSVVTAILASFRRMSVFWILLRPMPIRRFAMIAMTTTLKPEKKLTPNSRKQSVIARPKTKGICVTLDIL